MARGPTKILKRATSTFALVALVAFFALFVGVGGACDATLNLGSVDGGAADAAPLTCAATCTRLIDTCKLATVDQRATCLSQCTANARPSDLDCVAHTDCFAIVDLCANGHGLTTSDAAGLDASNPAFDLYEISVCQHGCDISFENSCGTAADHTECRDLCASVSSARRNAYASCAQGAGGDCSRQADCLAELAKD